jgi:hypothetical protein
MVAPAEGAIRGKQIELRTALLHDCDAALLSRNKKGLPYQNETEDPFISPH